MTEDDDIIYNSPHNTHAFTIDGQTSHRTLDEMATGTDADDWVKTHRPQRNTRKAWIELCEHYNGPTKGDNMVSVSMSNIVKKFYKNETKLSFKMYSTRLKRSFDMLHQYGQTNSNKEETEILLNQINRNNLQLISSIQTFRSVFSNKLLQAPTHLSTHMAQIFQ